MSLLKTHRRGEDGFNGDATFASRRRDLEMGAAGNFKDGGITLRGEFMLDDRDGLVDPDDALDTLAWNGQRRGAYLEGVYRFQPQLGRGLSLRHAVGRCRVAVRQHVRSVPPQRAADLAQQRVQPVPPAVQPRYAGSGPARQCAVPAIPDQPRAHGAKF